VPCRIVVESGSSGCHSWTLPVLSVATVLVAASVSSAQLFYEDFEDTTLTTNATQNFGTIAGGIISYNDTDANSRARFVVRQTFADLGQTLAEGFGVPRLGHGTSFLREILR
jgi:hypothetical protein